MSTRRLLGYHTAPGDRSVIEYSRDELASPLRELEKLYAAIKLGVFIPDETRSGQRRPGVAGGP
eukprot:14649592-Alexandrium_andersonii.AAC.1